MLVELTRQQAIYDEDIVPDLFRPKVDSARRKLRIVRHTHRVQRALNALERRYGKQGMEWVR